ncbi:TLDc domain-containing protein [Entamoeba marina]
MKSIIDVTAFDEFKKEVYEDVKTKFNLEKYSQEVEGSDEDVMLQYETWYDQLSEVVINHDNRLKTMHELVHLIQQEDKNMDEVKLVLNRLIQKMIEKQNAINEAKLKEFKTLKKSYDTKIVETFPNSFTTLPLDELLPQLEVSFNYLKEWSNRNEFKVLFDSITDGDGSNNTLSDKVIGRSQVFFITFDDKLNVFGGYIENRITQFDSYVNDSSSFTFSLIRNGKLKNIRYLVKSDKREIAFYLCSNSDSLYSFGRKYSYSNEGDIFINKIGTESSKCRQICFSYNGDQKPYVDKNSENFSVQRLLVIEMY